MSRTTNDYGVTHVCNAFFIIDTQYLHPITITNDIKMQRVLADFWVSFATNEVSNVGGVQWPRLNPNEKLLHYLYIAGSDKIQVGRSVNFDQRDFWNCVNFNKNKLYIASDILREEL